MFFRRVNLNKTAVTMVLGRLRSDDIYNQVREFLNRSGVGIYREFLF